MARYLFLCLIAVVFVASCSALENTQAPTVKPPVVSSKVAHPVVSKPINVASTLQTIQGEVDDIQWIGKDQKTVLVLSSLKVIYRSKDEGKTWQDQTVKFQAALASLKSAGSDFSPTVTKVVLSKADPALAFFVGEHGMHYVTRDSGHTITPVHSKEAFDIVLLHPTEKNMILASAMSAECGQQSSDDELSKGNCVRNLFITKDFGNTWTYLTDYVVQFDWVHNLARNQAKGLPLDGIVATTFHTKKGNQKFGYWDTDIDFVYTEDLFKSVNVEIPHGNRFLFTDKFMFVAAAHPDRSGEVNLHLSSNGGLNFTLVRLPYEIRQHSYTILDTSEDQVFLHVNHEGDGAAWGNVYLSDAVGQRYALSLPHNRRDLNGKCDFEKVDGLEGIYLANFINNPVYRDLDDPSATPEAPAIRTVITFDKGGVWGYLRPPAVDANGRRISCSAEDCSLHLHGITDEWGPFYSTKYALGLLMATGSVGTHLSTDRDDINTYFSRDGGLEWFEVAKGSHIYEFGNHGGLVVMANDHKSTHHILFSYNEGMTWHQYKFTQTPTRVDNIIIEPSSRSQRFILYGTVDAADGTESQGVLHMLDFTELHTRECRGHANPNEPGSDYEFWTPNDGRMGEKCLMGRTMKYVRRKRSSECYIPEVVERAVSRAHCVCTESDYECDTGYARKLEGGPCMPVDDKVTKVEPAPTCGASGTYKVTNGYRKVAGDSCTGGVDHNPTEFRCAHWFATAHHGARFSLVFVGLLIAALAVLTYQGKVDLREQLARLPGVGRFFSSNHGSGPAYGRIGELEPETAVNYPTYAGEEEDFGLDLDQDEASADATLLDGDGFGSRDSGLRSRVGGTSTRTAAGNGGTDIKPLRPPRGTDAKPAAAEADDLLADFAAGVEDTGDEDADFFGDSI